MPSHNWGAGDPRTSTANWRRLRRAVIVRDGNRCAQCGADGRIHRLDLDHIINVKRGGQDTLDNARLLCHACHKPKTQAEARAGIAARKARLRLPTEPHPGAGAWGWCTSR
ncbi:HNH endonuclease [Gordonia otitidis]|uniref:HNH endonuclease n=1 Tax=Gordonia otitidis TaxID=249058 RepID=UPI001D1359C1|nr:HNH endonuclease [Gordonia otitidis]UEA58574.1 HNH endonuclease [Gordonia otitidis]